MAISKSITNKSNGTKVIVLDKLLMPKFYYVSKSSSTEKTQITSSHQKKFSIHMILVGKIIYIFIGAQVILML